MITVRNITNKKIKIIFIPVLICLILIIPILFSGCTQEQEIKKHYLENYEEIVESYALGKKWIVDNVNDKGYFNYVYDPSTLEYSSNNNMIRQLMGSRLLAELSQENISLQNLHQKNLDAVFNYWYRENGNIGYIYFSSKSKLGAMAMMLRTLVYSPFFENYTEEAKKLANCILYLQNNDGSFNPWYIEPGYSYDEDYLLTFYSGEALLSLVEYYDKTGNMTVYDAMIKSQNYYVERYVENLSEHYYPAYVPWHTQSLNKIYKNTNDSRYADVIFTLNDELLKIQDTTNKKTLGRFYNASHHEYGSPHSSSDGVYTEGLAYAYEIAQLVNDTTHMKKYKAAIQLGCDNIISLQYNEENSKSFEFPERIIGAVRYNIDDYRIRVDTTQHILDGYLKILSLFD